jgi:hypothetical protein
VNKLSNEIHDLCPLQMAATELGNIAPVCVLDVDRDSKFFLSNLLRERML